ncbi:MAG: thiamine-phosphate pyrophosphorylase [Sphingomonadales bacterium]|jgi:thiamine-phosphate pyrophosphorylase|nr:thiamine-phosphate pyrophosphorylase [Sphingomonadales bacterium]
MSFQLPKLYPITDRRVSGLSHAEQLARLCEGGARLVQLREKHLSPREFFGEALEALRVARSFGATVVVNDRADVALAAGADGVHLGQDDLPPGAARALLGEGAVVGFSTHGVEQAVAASASPVDYIAVGPVYATSSKQNPDPVVGLEGVRRVRDSVGRVPLVAIGGITAENARAVLESGADSVAVIGALLLAADPAEITRRTRDFLSRL